MLKYSLSFFLLLFSSISYSNQHLDTHSIKIIFGSCSNQETPMPHWKHINSYNPNYLILLGDNVYGDFKSSDAENLKSAYSKLNKNKFFLNLRKNTTIYPIWDDHDYGVNDGGKYWPYKEIAQQLFLDFYNVQENDLRRKRKGIYHSWSITNNIKIKVIALDTRFFKDDFKKNYNHNIKKKYVPNYDTTKTILGEKQWIWLKEQIKDNYDILLLLSSIQVIPKEHGWEKWYNFPNERKKLLDLINNTQKLTIILSGDRHVGAMYKYNDNIYEVTSSSFNQKILQFSEKDMYSLGELVNQNNFGLININTLDRVIELELRTGLIKQNKVFKKLELNF